MKVLFITYNDYSNLCYNLSQSLKSVGIDSTALTRTPHEFGYTEQAIATSSENIKNQAQYADVIIIGHSSTAMLDLVRDLGKRVWVLHTGTPYRQKPELLNQEFDPYVERTLIDSPEFFNLGAKNVTYIAAAVDTDKVQFAHTGNEKPVFAHYPSKASVKGTDKIVEMMADFVEQGATFLCDETRVSHEDNLKRIAQCDVYLELFAPLQRGKCYGSFGVTAFEAAAMGKIVVTNSLYHEVYTRTYGNCELQVCNSVPDFKDTVQLLMNVEKGTREVMQLKARQWIVEKHSYQATGNYLLKLLQCQYS